MANNNNNSHLLRAQTLLCKLSTYGGELWGYIIEIIKMNGDIKDLIKKLKMEMYLKNSLTLFISFDIVLRELK